MEIETKNELESLMDMERIKSIFGDDDNSIKEFLQSFISSTEPLIENSKIALANKKIKKLKEFIHQLKGSSGNAGVQSIYVLCSSIEEKIQANEGLGIEDLISQIDTIFTNIKRLIKEGL